MTPDHALSGAVTLAEDVGFGRLRENHRIMSAATRACLTFFFFYLPPPIRFRSHESREAGSNNAPIARSPGRVQRRGEAETRGGRGSASFHALLTPRTLLALPTGGGTGEISTRLESRARDEFVPRFHVAKRERDVLFGLLQA